MLDLVNYLVEMRKTFKMFTVTEAASICGVTEMTVRNFESGATVNPRVMLYYLTRAEEAYDGHLCYGCGASYDESRELLRTEPQEYALYATMFTRKALHECMSAAFKKED